MVKGIPVTGRRSNRPWIFQSNGLGICPRHLVPLLKICLCALSPPNLAFGQNSSKIKGKIYLQQPKTVTQYRCVPRPCKAKTGRGEHANLQMVGSCKQFLWHRSRGMSNKAFLSLSIKKLPKECAVTSFGQQGGLQKVGFNRLGYMVKLGQ